MTRFAIILLALFSVFLCGLFYPNRVQATYFTEESFDVTLHPVVVSFFRDEEGIWHGTTDDDRTFLQYPVQNEYGLRIERFVIDDYSHYIVEGVVVHSLEELSKQMVLNSI